jgi:hypothetical protein
MAASAWQDQGTSLALRPAHHSPSWARSYTARDERRAPRRRRQGEGTERRPRRPQAAEPLRQTIGRQQSRRLGVDVGIPPRSVAHQVSTWVLDYLFPTVVATIMTPILLAWFSPSAWAGLYSLPTSAKLTGAAVLVALLLLAWRVSQRRALDRRELSISVPPAEWGYDELERVPHASAVWIVEAPTPPPGAADLSDEQRSAVASDHLVIRRRPRCEKCGVPIDEHRHLFGEGRRWSCPGCDDRRTTDRSWRRMALELQGSRREHYAARCQGRGRPSD